MSVTQKEIVDALNTACKIITDAKGVPAVIAYIEELANRIVAEGIAPPEWWVLVPKRPTQKMCEEVAEFDKRLSVFQACDIYTIMLAAAPKPEVK